MTRKGAIGKRIPLEERFWAKVNKTEGCWLWTGGKQRAGYGEIHLGGSPTRPRPAHRVYWEMANGPIPDGMFVCHSCDVPACVNPAHLFLGTPSDNMQDSLRKGRFQSPEARGWKRNITHCPQGHEYTPENTQHGRQPTGKHRACKACCSAYKKRKRLEASARLAA